MCVCVCVSPRLERSLGQHGNLSLQFQGLNESLPHIINFNIVFFQRPDTLNTKTNHNQDCDLCLMQQHVNVGFQAIRAWYIYNGDHKA